MPNRLESTIDRTSSFDELPMPFLKKIRLSIFKIASGLTSSFASAPRRQEKESFLSGVTSTKTAFLSTVLFLVPLATGLTSGCAEGDATGTTSTNAKNTADDKPKILKRPPHPNMANAAWGEHVLEELAEKANESLTEKGHQAALLLAKKQFHDVNAGAEVIMRDAAVAAWRTAMNDQERSAAAAVVALSLVMDPNLDGYADRLTDAHGIGVYAGSLPNPRLDAQATRGLVAIATGRVTTGKKVIKEVTSAAGQQKLGAYTHLLLAQAVYLASDRSDVLFDQIDYALKKHPDSARARMLRFRGLLSAGATDPIVAEKKNPALSPRESALVGRALCLSGDEAGIPVLESVLEKVPDGERGEVLFWLGMAFLQDPLRAKEAVAVVEKLRVQKGYRGEALLLNASIALQSADYLAARKNADILTKRPGVSKDIGTAAAWLLVDACAALGDEECVKNSGRNAVLIDGNRARLAHAWAALNLIGGKKKLSNGRPLKVKPHQQQAHLFSPFDEKLAALVRLPVVEGGQKAAADLRAVRSFIAQGAYKPAKAQLATPALAINQACGPCRALIAIAEPDLKKSNNLALKALQNSKRAPIAEADSIALIDILQRASVPKSREELKRIAKKHASKRVRAAAVDALEGKRPSAPSAPGHVHVPGGHDD
ncbi:MAG: hypothetical protein GY822_02300 [Deltaproteobacteria bacterium]|nr:hypothetical protein [Deltaproteobacteria bacterium]